MKTSTYHKRFVFLCVLLATLTFCACGNVDNNRVQTESLETHVGSGISIITVDSCEYVWVKKGYGGGLSHKGNCKYCARRVNKM